MIQALMINGTPAEYSINTENIIAVLGTNLLPQKVTYNAVLEIIYRGLIRKGGYSCSAFIVAVQKGEIYPSRSRKHYPIYFIKQRVIARIRQTYRGFRKHKARG